MSEFQKMDRREISPVSLMSVVCPRPRRASPGEAEAVMPARIQVRYDEPWRELLELMLVKDELKAEPYPAPSSPPFFLGSPPCRASNPLVQDIRFRVGKSASFTKSTSDSVSPRLARSREQCGAKKSAVRVEGFDCKSPHAVAMV